MLYSYGITPMHEDHFEARAADIADQVKRGVITMPLFCMTLVPEGNPIWDKVGKMAKIYERYRDYLEPQGVKCGILIQASLGHGYKIDANPFTKYVNFTDGSEVPVCCPEDENFLAHFAEVIKRLAALHPGAIMLDDDFRLMMRPGKGCACELHMKEFNRRSGLSMTRAELLEHVKAHGDDDPLTNLFRDLQTESLVKAAKVFRAAIDSVDPTIQGINCTSGFVCESVHLTNKIFAGEGNPTTVRIPNGIYAPYSIRGFSSLMRSTAICSARLRANGIENILAETDTIPFNRYAKSARYLHAHYTASLMEGLVGAKHWLTRTSSYELASGKAYRDILAKHRGFYEALVPVAREIEWLGIGHVYTEQTKFSFTKQNPWSSGEDFFTTQILERMGLPFFFTDRRSSAVYLEASNVDAISDDRLRELFEGGSVFCDAPAAERLAARGFSEYLGVTLEPWGEHPHVNFECFDAESEACLRVTPQKSHRYLTPTNEKVRIASHNIRINDGRVELLSPGVTVYERGNGRLTVVFCGTPNAYFTYGEGFSFLNESRKAQLISLLREAGALPIWCDGDDEICLRAGRLRDGTVVAALYELGIDPTDTIVLGLETKPTKIERLEPDGSRRELKWRELGGSRYEVETRVETLNPVVLFIG